MVVLAVEEPALDPFPTRPSPHSARLARAGHVLQGVASGADHTVARDDGPVIARGADTDAQLGDGAANPTRESVTVLPAGSAVMRVATTGTGRSGFAY
ncbi:hypothetical protein ACIRP2_14540 [Streptomyces sp. NPDC101194]|uniref:hypothetical protein n=1 Tax=Streptomyces sp. NPDC101194 TaxID=3366127 RepID=UPI00382F8EBF